MSLPVLLRQEASEDVEEARDYYEAQKPNLGQAFLDRLNELLARIGAMPEMYGFAWRDVRAALLRRFAHVVYYRVHADRVEVLAVVHGSRNAPGWRSRA
jgi:toxin ParE1/3/4